MSHAKLPGPGFLGAVKIAYQASRNYLKPLEDIFADYGDYSGLQVGPPVAFVFHPDGIQHVLKTNFRNYVKTEDMEHLKPVLGEGLLTSEGEHWREHRKIIGPEFSNKRVEGFYPVIYRHLHTMIREWRDGVGVRDGVLNVSPPISKTTYEIAGECFFGSEVEDSAGTVYHAVEVSSRVAVRRMGSLPKLPLSFPTPEHLRLKRAVRELDEVVHRIIEQRRSNLGDKQDVLSRLIRMNLDAKAIRDEVMTLLLAGHETTSNATSWTMYLLGQHPRIQEVLREELMTKVSGEIPTLAEIPSLHMTRMVLEESMRLYPPAALIGRKSIGEDVIGGYKIAPGTKVMMVQWVTHKHPEFWRNPLEFIPERFAEGESRHPFAYFPFAAGPRECVGKTMAMLEGIVLLAAIVKNFRFEVVKDVEVKIDPLITLRPNPGVVVRISAL